MASYLEYKKLIEEGKQVDFKELSDYMDSLIFSATFGINEYFRRYCLMYSCIDHVYDEGLDHAMSVSVEGNKLCLSINPLICIRETKNEDQILFIFAHEMKHLLYNHLEKYSYLLSIDVVSQLMNIATDCEVNSSLAKELSGYPRSIPTGFIDKKFICNLCSVTPEYLDTYLYHNKYGTHADCVFELINKYMKRVLGYDADEILYRCKIQKTTFAENIFLVASGEKSSVFSITDGQEATRFCRILANYLKSPAIPLLRVSGEEEDGFGVSDFELGHIVKLSEDLYNILSENDLFGSYKRNCGVSLGTPGKIKKEQYKSEISWQGILRNTCSQLSEKSKYSKKRISRRQPYRLEISGKVKELRFSIIVGIDNSSSITNEEYNYFMSELYAVLKNYDCSVYILNFTSRVDQELTLSTKKEVASYFKTVDGSRISRFFGGTSFQPVFDAINKNKSINTNRTLVIMFTDGEAESKVDFGKCDKRMWVLVGTNGKKRLSCPEVDKNIFPIVKLRRK